ncbi:hypothetical protein ABVT39_018001 [Epinephelus coioides]
MATRAKKRNFTDTEIEVLVGEVETNQKILFGTLNAGVTNQRKNAAWEKVTTAVNSIGSEERSLKKKWFDIKIRAKKRVTAHRHKISATGGGQATTTQLSPIDNRIASIIGDTALCGIFPDGDTDTLPTQPAVPSTSHTAETQASRACPQEPEAMEELGELEEQEQPGPSKTHSVRPGGARVLTEAVLQNQQHTTNSINEIKDQLTNITNTLLQINKTGGALPIPLQIETLPIIGVDEVVHDVPDVDLESEDLPSFPDVERVVCEDDLVKKKAAIVYHDNLRMLATFLQLPIQNCPAEGCHGKPPFEVTVASRGSAVILQWLCPYEQSVWKWNSQPLLKFSMQGGDFMLATNILLSGNNYAKIALLFKSMNMGIVANKTFFHIQDTYCVDTVKEFWLEKRAEVIDRLRTKDHVVVLGDGRMDSPGHCAQYCTYTTIEQESRDIVHIVTVDKRETNKNSVVMEREGFIQTMDALLQEIAVKEVVTSVHTQISALMGSAAHQDLSAIVLDKRLLKNVNKLINFRNKRCYNKKSQRWSVYTVKVQKDYIPELQRAILGKRVLSRKGLPKRRPPHRDMDARKLGLLPDKPPPPTDRTQIPQGQLLNNFDNNINVEQHFSEVSVVTRFGRPRALTT